MEDAGRKLAMLADTVIVTLASEGAIAFSHGRMDAFACEPVANPDKITSLKVAADVK